MVKDDTQTLINKKFGRLRKHKKNKNGFTDVYHKNLEKFKNEHKNKMFDSAAAFTLPAAARGRTLWGCQCRR